MRQRTKTALAVLVFTATVLAGCGSSGSSDASKATTTSSKSTTSTTAVAPSNPDETVCGTAGYVASNGSTDPAVWSKITQRAQAIKTSGSILTPLRELSASYAKNDQAGATSARAKLVEACKAFVK